MSTGETSIDDQATSTAVTTVDRIRRGLRSVFEVSDDSSPATRSITLVIWGAWCALVIVLLWTHDPWRDELQAWGLVRASSTPLDVLGNLRHEGHPPSWYLLLWPFTLVTRSFVALKVVTFGMGAAATWIVLRTMPLSLWLRTAIVFSYFPLFEFGTISRSYSLTWLLTVTALWLANRRGTPNWMIAVVLAALAGTTVLAVPLAVAIAIGIWGGRWFASPTRGPINIPWVAAFVAVPTLVAIVALPAAGGGPSVRLSQFSPSSIATSSAAVLRAAFPVMEQDTAFWGRFIVRDWTTWGPLLGLAILAVVTWSVRRSRTALTVWLLSSIGFVLLRAATGVPLSPRLISPLWDGLIAAVWFAAVDRRAVPTERRRPMSVVTMLAVTFLLGASLWSAAWAVRVGTTTPFTSAAAAARWIDEQAAGRDVVILCAIDRAMCSSVSMRLDVPAYVTGDGEPFEFVDYAQNWRRTLPAGQIRAAADELAQRTGAEVFVVAPWKGFPAGCETGLWPQLHVVTEYVLVCRADRLVPAGK